MPKTRTPKQKRDAERYRATFELYKKRSRDYRKQNLEFVNVLEFYKTNWDEGALAEAVIQSFKIRCETPTDYETDYRQKFYAEPPDKDKS